MFLTALLLSAALASETADTPKDMKDCPMHAQHMKEAAAAQAPAQGCSMHADHAGAMEGSAHAAMVDHNHDSFGMSHDATTHHFRLFADGGAIELRANDAADAASVDAIRTHLRSVADAFSASDFSAPLFVHGRTPSGVDTMKSMKEVIRYRYEALPDGGRIRIATSDARALAAVHDFLRFQIEEHRTGDPGKTE